MHAVKLSLHPEVSIMVTVNVARSIDEAKIQDKTGAAIISTEEEPSETSAQHQSNADEKNDGLDITSIEKDDQFSSKEISDQTAKEIDIKT
jgi:large subunit ribosomal protein L9